MNKFHVGELVKIKSCNKNIGGMVVNLLNKHDSEMWIVKVHGSLIGINQRIFEKLTPQAGDTVSDGYNEVKVLLTSIGTNLMLLQLPTKKEWFVLDAWYVIDRPQKYKYVKVKFDGGITEYTYRVREELEVKAGDRVVVTNSLKTKDKFATPRVVEVFTSLDRNLATKQIVDVVDQSRYLAWVAKQEQEKILAEKKKRKEDLILEQENTINKLATIELELKELGDI